MAKQRDMCPEAVEFRKAKGRLRILNIVNLIICIGALLCMFLQPYWKYSIRFEATVGDMQNMVQSVFSQEVSAEDLEGAGFSFAVDYQLSAVDVPQAVSTSFANRSNGLEGIRSGFAVLSERCVRGALRTVLPAVKDSINVILSVYLKTVVADKQEEALSPATVAEYQAIIDSLIEEENLTVEGVVEQVRTHLQANQAEYGLTDEDLASICDEVEHKFTRAADVNGEVSMEAMLAQILKAMHILSADEEIKNDTAEDQIVSGILSATRGAIDYFFLGMCFLYLLQAFVWLVLLIKTVVKVCTGHPMIAPITKGFTALPYILTVLIPSLLLLIIGVENIPVIMGLIMAQASEPIRLSLSLGGCFGAAIATLALFIFGFFYKPSAKHYQYVKKAYKLKRSQAQPTQPAQPAKPAKPSK